ncbi:EamA family transporter [Sporolactobacillus shoreae]|uniref:EamA family transporter n=1 Tax=Sporolactobacillus shoreae TaxID=1465501 RepID=A0A4Z0GNT2_9BACL|nr:EamA family transporter [Sporolactobacillus shoreae]
MERGLSPLTLRKPSVNIKLIKAGERSSLEDRARVLEKGTSLNRLFGIVLVLSGAILWGVSGNVAQYLFRTGGINPGWLTSVRMLSAGSLLIIAVLAGEQREVAWKIWADRKSRAGLLIFGLCGMIGAQYTYFEAVAAGNAATATLLQYLNPVIIIVYLLIKWKKKPSIKEVAAIFLALAGVFLLVTKGHPNQISIAPAALFWGILSAFGGAVYSMQPAALLKRWGAAAVVGWGMIIGGLAMSSFYPPWIFRGQLNLETLSCVAFVILFGTFAAFYLYLASLKFLQPIETSLLGCAEPLSAAVVSVVWLSVPFTVSDWFGAVCIVSTVVVLALSRKTNH